jgi:hypothetical protein
MMTFDKGADPAAVRRGSARRPARRRLAIALVVLAAALVFQPGESRAFSIGPILHMFLDHHGRGHPRHSGKGPRRIVHKAHPDKEKPGEKPGVKEPDGPIFSAAR